MAGTQLLEGCPGYELNQLAPPNIDWCEASVCSVIAEPANTWSNLAYLFAGLLLIHWSRRGTSRALKLFGPAQLIVGATSFAYHATNNFYSQVVDFLGMYVFCYLLLVLNLRRMATVSEANARRLFISAVLVTTVATAALSWAGFRIQLIVMVLIFAILATEGLAWRRRTERYSVKYFGAAVLLLLAGAVCSAADHSRLWCDPQNHWVQGHAVWHVLGALSLCASYLHYARLPRDDVDQGARAEKLSRIA